MARKYRTVNDAYAYVGALVEKYAAANQTRLPPMTVLARGAGVAVGTMVKAVRRLRDGGVVRVSHGRGIEVCSAAPVVHHHSRPKEHICDRLTSSLYADIVGGPLASRDKLPSSKELCARYGIHNATLRRALLRLVADGCIRAAGRSYTVVRPGSSGFGKVILVLRGFGHGDVLADQDAHYLHVRQVERLAGEHNLELETVSYYYEQDDFIGFESLRKTIRRAPHALGLIFITTGFPRSHILAALRETAGAAKPCAILSTGELSALPSWCERRRTRLWAPAEGEEPGMRMAHFLAGLGHRRIAYIDEEPLARWAQTRFRGFAACCCRAGVPTELDHFTVKRRISDDESARVARSAQDQAQSLMLRSARRKRGDPLRIRSMHTNTIAGSISAYVRTHALFDGVRHLLDTILPQNAHTALVGASDTIAAGCLEYCVSHRTRVPQDISIAGFDESKIALVNDFTSYDFRYDTCIAQMYDYILNPSRHRRYMPDEQGNMVPGAVVVRGSTGRAQEPH